MKNKKIICLLLALLMTISIVALSLVGCAGKEYNLTVAVAEHGTVSVEGDIKVAKSGTELTVTVTPAEGYRLANGGLTYTGVKKFGTNYASGNAITGTHTFTIPMLGEDMTIAAKFEPIPKEGDVIRDKDNNPVMVYKGMYPQSLKSDSVSIDETDKDANGYYLGSDGNRYAKVVTGPYAKTDKEGNVVKDKKGNVVMLERKAFTDDVTFSNGRYINEYVGSQKEMKNTTYYFLVEPIAWKILKTADGKYTVMSDLILDNKAFLTEENSIGKGISNRYNNKVEGAKEKKIYANNYEHSDIREFLTGEFFTKAFADASDLVAVDIANGDGSVAKDNSYSETNANTNDKIYLFSYQEIYSKDYKFQTIEEMQKSKEIDPLKLAFTTDYARANGAWTNAKAGSGNNFGMGYWWTRSSGNKSNYISVINSTADVNIGGIPAYKDMIGVRPVITLNGLGE